MYMYFDYLLESHIVVQAVLHLPTPSINLGNHGMSERLNTTASPLDKQLSLRSWDYPIERHFVRHRHTSSIFLFDTVDLLEQCLSQ